jgi:hypothetical protein
MAIGGDTANPSDNSFDDATSFISWAIFNGLLMTNLVDKA